MGGVVGGVWWSIVKIGVEIGDWCRDWSLEGGDGSVDLENFWVFDPRLSCLGLGELLEPFQEVWIGVSEACKAALGEASTITPTEMPLDQWISWCPYRRWPILGPWTPPENVFGLGRRRGYCGSSARLLWRV